jgi:hypothetical protein
MTPKNIYELLTAIEEIVIENPNDAELGKKVRALSIAYNQQDADSGNLASQ